MQVTVERQEETLEIEYIESVMPPTKLASLPHEEWVSSISCFVPGFAPSFDVLYFLWRPDIFKAATSSQVHTTVHYAYSTADRPSFTLRPSTQLLSRPSPSCRHHNNRRVPKTRIDCSSQPPRTIARHRSRAYRSMDLRRPPRRSRLCTCTTRPSRTWRLARTDRIF
jgi:hypothetical protein